jgi:hypothetical protein
MIVEIVNEEMQDSYEAFSRRLGVVAFSAPDCVELLVIALLGKAERALYIRLR